MINHEKYFTELQKVNNGCSGEKYSTLYKPLLITCISLSNENDPSFKNSSVMMSKGESAI